MSRKCMYGVSVCVCVFNGEKLYIRNNRKRKRFYFRQTYRFPIDQLADPCFLTLRLRVYKMEIFIPAPY